jgi:hypothetical protein
MRPRTIRPRTMRPRTKRPLDDPSLGRSVPWTIRPLDDPSPGRSVPWTIRPLDDPSPGRSVPWTIRPRDKASPWTYKVLSKVSSGVVLQDVILGVLWGCPLRCPPVVSSNVSSGGVLQGCPPGVSSRVILRGVSGRTPFQFYLFIKNFIHSGGAGADAMKRCLFNVLDR